MGEQSQAPVFRRAKEPHTLILARGDTVRHVTLRPWATAALGAAVALAAVGYLTATTYLVLRDDLFNASVARQARLQQAYEDRISALRTQVDRITSRQVLDQQVMELKVSELLDRQQQLADRHVRLAPVLSRAGLLPSEPTPPAPRPDERAELGLQGMPANESDRLFGELSRSLSSIETEQLAKIDRLADDAYRTTSDIRDALNAAGLEVQEDDTAQGGPFIPASAESAFDAKVRNLDEALEALEDAKADVAALPLANPAEGRAITSTFGLRRDPLIGATAMHAGIDFRTPTGTAVRASGGGRVVKSGWNGGYGKMVEIEHADGFSSRYAHLSRIDVAEGEKVEAGAVIGETGNTGRSTGPHLHYEVRENGDALNPLRFLRAGKAISPLL
ncbi:MAG: peptidase [Mesorhizobium amorphae]|nr:MAG: peptidase [Mesorhizobium amorphae]